MCGCASAYEKSDASALRPEQPHSGRSSSMHNEPKEFTPDRHGAKGAKKVDHQRTRPKVEALDITSKPIDHANCIQLDYSKCIGCHNCARACDEWQGFHVLTKGPVKIPPYVKSHYGDAEKNDENHRIKLATTDCVGCGACVAACPVNALVPYSQIHLVKEALAGKQYKVAVVAPATRVGVAEGMGMPVGSSCERQLVKALHELGFDKVYDNLFGADICTREDLSEILEARKEGKSPVFTSCCPAWIRLAEEKYPSLLPRISTAKSPQGIICSIIKQHMSKEWKRKPKDIFVAGFMPCTSKKNECVRDELKVDGVPECDVNITSRELIDWLKERKIEFSEDQEYALKDEEIARFDGPFNKYSGSAYIYGKTSGVTEAVLRQICQLNGEEFNRDKITSKTIFVDEATGQNIKMLEFPSGNELYRVAVAAGGTAVRTAAQMVVEGQLQCDCVEMMCCPHGCISGGGQPKNMKKMEIPLRARGLDQADSMQPFQASGENKAVDELYARLGEHEIHRIFHTKFTAWEE